MNSRVQQALHVFAGDTLLASLCIIMGAALTEAIMPGFITGMVDVRWFFLSMALSLVVLLAAHSTRSAGLDGLRVAFGAFHFLCMIVLIALIIALQGNSLLVRLASLVVSIGSLIIFFVVSIYDSRRHH